MFTKNIWSSGEKSNTWAFSLFKKFQDNSDMHLEFKKWLQVFLLDPSFGDLNFYYFSVDQSWYNGIAAAAAAKSLQLCPTLCDPIDGSPPGFPSLGFSRQEHWSGLPFPSPMHESEKWKGSCSVVSDSRDPMDCSLPGSSVHGIF